METNSNDGNSANLKCRICNQSGSSVVDRKILIGCHFIHMNMCIECNNNIVSKIDDGFYNLFRAINEYIKVCQSKAKFDQKQIGIGFDRPSNG